MTRSRPHRKGKSRDPKLTAEASSTETSSATPTELIKQAVEATNEFDPKKALKCYQTAISKLEPTADNEESQKLMLEALQAAAFILLEMGKVEDAQSVSLFINQC